MSAERLREAAAKFRAVVKEADDHTVNGASDDPRVRSVCAGSAEHLTLPRSAALAVADLLDVWADNDLAGSPFTLPEELACITDLVDAYLGTTR